MGLYTTLFVFCYLIYLKLLNKEKIENFVFKQIQSNIPIYSNKYKVTSLFIMVSYFFVHSVNVIDRWA